MKQEETASRKGGGCMAKLGPGALAKTLDKLPRAYDPSLLIGYEGADDVVVYKLMDDPVMIQTLDFSPPMVGDPYIFGQIAAVNALSNVYAMDGDMKTALNIVCFPETMDLNILGKILLGGDEKVREAGGALAGGYSIANADVKYGLSVTGTIHPDKVFVSNGCREGDVLLLTKPLGVGIVCTASRVGEKTGAAMDLAVKFMISPNRYASEIVRKYRVHDCTDATGLGFLGHLCEMLGDSYTALIHKDRIPFISGCEAYAEEFYIVAAGQRNRNHVGIKVEFVDRSFALEEILHDPQTSGGLLVPMERQDADRAPEELRGLGLPRGMVGGMRARGEKAVVVS